MQTFEIILSVISGLSLICALGALIFSKRAAKQSSSEDFAVLNSKISDLTKSTSDEFQRNRIETHQSLENMSAKLEAMTKLSYENREKMNETIAQSLNMIRDKSIEQNERQSKIIETSIQKMQESNEKKLDQMRMTVDEKLTSTLTTRLDSSFKTVSEQLEKLYKSLGEMKELSNGVTSNVTTLNRVLTNVKARGTWAEVQLKGILDQTIPTMYEENVATGEKATERVEFAVKIPSGEKGAEPTLLPIDSKFPMEDYIRLCDAADNADAAALAAARKALEDRILGEAKEIRKYINVPKTTPYAIMYLATEGLYAEIASSRSGLPEKLQNEYNIMIAGPITITALLNSLSMGFKTVAINEKANEVRKLLAACKTQYDIFGTVLQKAKKKIDDAGRSLDDAQHRNSIIQKKLRGVEDIERSEAENILSIDQGLADTEDDN